MSFIEYGQRLEITRACLERGLEANDHMLEMMQWRIQEALAAREAEIFAAIMAPSGSPATARPATSEPLTVETIQQARDRLRESSRDAQLAAQEATWRRAQEYLINHHCFSGWVGPASLVDNDLQASDAKPSREARFDALRAEGKKLGEINDILEVEGYSEVFGEGVMPCPTKHHAIVRENKGARKLIASLTV